MNKMKLMAVTLLAICFAAPAFAQSAQEQKFEKALEQQAVTAARKNDVIKEIHMAASKKDVSKDHLERILQKMELTGLFTQEEMQRAKDEVNTKPTAEAFSSLRVIVAMKLLKSLKVCAYCGEEITSEGQHCPAQGYVALCSNTIKSNKPASVKSVPSVCPLCGQALSIDERFHGAKHVCPKAELDTCASKAQTKEYCIYCGEEITSSSQHCAASGYTTLCTVSCPECGADLRNPENLDKSGTHHCKFKTIIKPVEIKK